MVKASHYIYMLRSEHIPDGKADLCDVLYRKNAILTEVESKDNQKIRVAVVFVI